ncbi:hypothetical protein GCM10027275_27790 [Rhabdobacter roseus]|uniref:Tetratricopeptide (TPR) repeat protein n=1 Tax=Rhabdobacter roseus TaxID=1655419 RepID=A0A840TSR2_9BACT|nr:tetratricopeptide repeat protein [Rhabdobacter roseus]MBB5284727.1 tetratricopeptide (TPR) repeat protein [Rhabdobacter roseus]
MATIKATHWLGTLLLLFWVGGAAPAQTIRQTYELAEAHFVRADYPRAVEAYRRVLFFDEQEAYGPLCYRKIADCLYFTEQFDEAALFYDRAYYVTPDDSTQAHLLFQKASCYLLTQNYRYAQIELFNLPDSLPEAQEKRRQFYLGILYFSLEEYETSEGYFQALAPDSAAREAVRALFVRNEAITRFNPRKARRLSIFLPGMGQFYAGDVKNGLNSLLLTSGLFYWGVRLLATGSTFPDAFITIMPWFQRYYVGGYKKAEIIATEQKQKRRHQLYNQLLDVVERE